MSRYHSGVNKKAMPVNDAQMIDYAPYMSMAWDQRPNLNLIPKTPIPLMHKLALANEERKTGRSFCCSKRCGAVKALQAVNIACIDAVGWLSCTG